MGPGCVAWAGHLTFSSLGFAICKMGFGLLHGARGCTALRGASVTLTHGAGSAWSHPTPSSAPSPPAFEPGHCLDLPETPGHQSRKEWAPCAQAYLEGGQGFASQTPKLPPAPAPWTQGLPSVVPPPGLLSLPWPLQRVCWTPSQPLQLVLEKWPIPFLGPPQRVVGCGVTGSLLESGLGGAGGRGSGEGTEVWTL